MFFLCCYQANSIGRLKSTNKAKLVWEHCTISAIHINWNNWDHYWSFCMSHLNLRRNNTVYIKENKIKQILYCTAVQFPHHKHQYSHHILKIFQYSTETIFTLSASSYKSSNSWQKTTYWIQASLPALS